MEVDKKNPSVSKEIHLQNNINLVKSYITQHYDWLEKKFDIVLDKDDRECIRNLVVCIVNEKHATTELNEHKLELADEITRNQNFWKNLDNPADPN